MVFSQDLLQRLLGNFYVKIKPRSDASANPSKDRGPQAADRPTTAPSPLIIFLSWLPKAISNPKRNYPPLKEQLKLDKSVGVNVGWVEKIVEKRLNYSHLQKSVKESRGAKPWLQEQANVTYSLRLSYWYYVYSYRLQPPQPLFSVLIRWIHWWFRKILSNVCLPRWITFACSNHSKRFVIAISYKDS